MSQPLHEGKTENDQAHEPTLSRDAPVSADATTVDNTAARAAMVCGDCALHSVTYKYDVELPGNEYMGTCWAPRSAGLPTDRWHDDQYAQACKEFREKGRPVPGRNFF